MQTEFCKKLGLDAPMFAFTHCRDVVVAVSKAGGIGVLGAVGFYRSAAERRAGLDRRAYWRSHLRRRHGHSTKVRGHGRRPTRKKLVEMLQAAIPEQHRKFADKLLKDARCTRVARGG